MADIEIFAIEEYKALQERNRQSRDIGTRLEIATVVGTVVALGFLLGIGTANAACNVIPVFVWWSIVLIVIAGAVRCWSYHIYVWRIQSYLIQIECEMMGAGYKLQGFETFNRGKLVGPFLIYALSFIVWGSLFGIVTFIAIWKSMGWKIP